MFSPYHIFMDYQQFVSPLKPYESFTPYLPWAKSFKLWFLGLFSFRKLQLFSCTPVNSSDSVPTHSLKRMRKQTRKTIFFSFFFLSTKEKTHLAVDGVTKSRHILITYSLRACHALAQWVEHRMVQYQLMAKNKSSYEFATTKYAILSEKNVTWYLLSFRAIILYFQFTATFQLKTLTRKNLDSHKHHPSTPKI